MNSFTKIRCVWSWLFGKAMPVVFEHQTDPSRFRHDWLVKKLHTEREVLASDLSSSPPTNACEKKFLDDMKSIGSQTETSDVSIRVRHRSYRCHRAVLAARSPYFHTLFHSKFQEKSQEEIDLSSFLPRDDDFDLLHSYIYTGETSLSPENVLQYVELSDKFLLEDLFEFCQMFLLAENHITATNVWSILEMCNTLERKGSLELQKKCFDLLKENRHLINDQCHDLLRRHPHLSVELVKYFV